ncbi:MAG: c-type cytochrome biogenesis protein CcmI [Alphaproteobacteria bacterium]
MIYALLTLLALASAAVIAWPLMRRPKDDVERSDAATALYRAQLLELETDLERGLISAAEAESARIEIQRRLLRESDQTDLQSLPSPGGTRSVVAITLIALTIVGSALLYLERGHPDLAWAPAPDRMENVTENSDVDTLVLQLAKRMEERPDDIEGWLLLGPTAQTVGRFDLAVEAYRQTIRLRPDEPALKLDLGQALTAEAAGLVTDEARSIFQQVLDASPGEPVARYHLGLADFQARDFESAHLWWNELAREIRPESPWAGRLEHGLKRISDVTGTPMPAPASPRGPTQADMEAAAQMSESERADMIRGMVDGLAARLEDEPEDLEGWLRLARAYMVLGEQDNARTAFEGALKADPGNSDALAGLSSLGRPMQE